MGMYFIDYVMTEQGTDILDGDCLEIGPSENGSYHDCSLKTFEVF